MDKQFEFLVYQVEDENISVDAFVQDETIWVTANQMAVLFDKSESMIRKHINNVFDEGELERKNNTQKVRVDGVKQPVAFYNLDTIISVGYRVNSRRATKFRIWATGILKEPESVNPALHFQSQSQYLCCFAEHLRNSSI